MTRCIMPSGAGVQHLILVSAVAVIPSAWEKETEDAERDLEPGRRGCGEVGPVLVRRPSGRMDR